MPSTRIIGQIDESSETKQEICQAWNVHALVSLGLHEAHVPRQDGCEAIGLTGETEDQNRDGGIRALKLLGDSMCIVQVSCRPGGFPGMLSRI